MARLRPSQKARKTQTLPLHIYTDTHTNTLLNLTCPPLLVEKILIVPPHCFTYQRNQRAETSCGSEVTFTLTNSVANRRTALEISEKIELNNSKQIFFITSQVNYPGKHCPSFRAQCWVESCTGSGTYRNRLGNL